ncbi:MFS transporter [Vibrio cionasavignyae]|uniref:MFS transporter n=1 Tax=Vibrio cionasavignyae TaxID=2910252 RepID=UPI003D124C00
MFNDTSITGNARPSNTSLYTICLFASLIGFGQNALLVSLPILVTTTDITLASWSMLIAVGTVLFIPTAPYWGKRSDRRGPKSIVLTALLGLSLCFSGMAATLFALDKALLTTTAALVLLAMLRIVYGVTVSGLVPACQHWAILTVGEQHRLSAITSVSASLSMGRVLSPVLAVALIKLDPLFAITVVGFAALGLFVVCLMTPALTPKPITHTALDKPITMTIPRYLIIALLLCSALGVLHYSLTPLLSAVSSLSAESLSDWVGYLLTLSAVVTLATQIGVVKKKKLSLEQMLFWGGLLLIMGYSLFLLANIIAYLVGISLLSVGNAILTPAYTTKAMSKQSGHQGQISGLLATSHTLGFALSALFVTASTALFINPLWFSVLFAFTLFTIITYPRLQRT